MRTRLRRPAVKLNLETLEDRWCPASATWYGTVNNQWDNPLNWSNHSIPIGPDQIATFDGGHNVPCDFNFSNSGSKVLLQNGYNAKIEVSTSCTMTAYGLGIGGNCVFNLQLDSDLLNREFGTFYLHPSGSTEMGDFNLTDSMPGGGLGQFIIDSGSTVNMGDISGLTVNMVDSVTINGTLIIGDYSSNGVSTIHYKDTFGNIITVAGAGVLKASHDRVGASSTLISNDGDGGEILIGGGASRGTMLLTGYSGTTGTSVIDMPITVEGNLNVTQSAWKVSQTNYNGYGIVNANGGAIALGSSAAASLVVAGNFEQLGNSSTECDSTGSSFYMTNDASGQMDFYEGLLIVGNGMTFKLGGQVQLGEQSDINPFTLSMGVNAGSSACSLLSAYDSATKFTIVGGATGNTFLSVSKYGSGTYTGGWTLLDTSAYGNNISGDFFNVAGISELAHGNPYSRWQGK
jgi:hypothetical protein